MENQEWLADSNYLNKGSYGIYFRSHSRFEVGE